MHRSKRIKIGNTITNIKLPNSDSDAATKAYVDDGRGLGDEIKDLRSLQYQSHASNQLLVSTEYKLSSNIIKRGSL